MAENKKSGTLPAQARLLKLKKNLKESKEMARLKSNQENNPKTQTSKSTYVEESKEKARLKSNQENNPKAQTSISTYVEEKGCSRSKKSLIKASKLKNQGDSRRSIDQNVNVNISKPSPTKKGFREEEVAQKLKKKLKDNGKINNKKESSTKSIRKKRGSSSSSNASPSKSSAKAVDSQSSSSSIADKIRNFIGKISYFSGSNQKKTTSENKSQSSKDISPERKRIFVGKPINLSANIQTNESSHRINCATSGKTPIPLESPVEVKKTTPPITETGKRNLFKRQRDLSPPKKLDKNSKLLESERVSPKAKAEDSASISATKRKTVFSYKIKKKKTADFENASIYISSPLTQSEPDYFKDTIASKTSAQSKSVKKEPCFIDNEINTHPNDDQAMEWEPNKDQILRFTRNETTDGDEEMMDWQDGISESNRNQSGEKYIYFVCDTNVLIQSLSLIRKLIMIKLRGFAVIVMVPWQVLKELDKLKTISNTSVAFCARKASKFLSESQNEGCNIIFQKQLKHFEDCHQVLVEVPDDHLIKCCCQLKNENKKVILLSNDTNLRVKASATGGFPAVPDSWVSALIQKNSNLPSSQIHCFENEPMVLLSNAERTCAQFLYKLTKCVSSFLFDVIRVCLQKKYDELWELWIPNTEMSLKDKFSFAESLTILEPYQKQIQDIWKFYQEKSNYKDVKAKDIEKLGRNCILLAKSIHHLFPEIGSQCDRDMGFLKTGDIGESCYGYTSASSMIAQNYFKRMEDKLNFSLNHLSQLTSKLFSQRIVIPDTKEILNNIDRNITVTNEASTVFLLMDKDEELPLNTPEVVLFHKILLNFLDESQDEYSLPIFSPEDIVMYINQERSHLNPAALHWLSDVRRQFMEYKSVLREH